MKKLALLLIALAACDSGPTTTAVSAADAEAYCEVGCEHDVTCNGEDLEICKSECVSGVAGWVREDALAELADCQAGLACTADADSCIDECTPTGAHEAYETQCRDNLAGCDVGADALDQICETTPALNGDVGSVCLVASEIMNELTACFTDPETGCATYQPCLSAVLEDYGVGN